MIISGMDPGKNGALVTLFEDGSTLVNRVPLKEGKIRPGRKSAARVPDEVRWAQEWRRQLIFNAPDVFVVEAVHGWKGQSAGASFAFGRATGFAMATLMSVNVPFHPVAPNVWKAKMGISTNKAHSIEEALRLIPSLAPHLTHQSDDGVAEAGLLAYYGIMTIAAR